MSTQALSDSTIRVVILGVGYAGVMATHRFLGSLTDEERRRVQLTLVNPRAGFVERIRLHQLAAGSRDCVTIPLTDMLHPEAALVAGTSSYIDHRSRAVPVSTGNDDLDLDYDYLVDAVGSVAAAPIRGSREHAFMLADYEDARKAAASIAACDRGAQIAVVGGGFTGVEAASELADRCPAAKITLYCANALLSNVRPSARKSITKILHRKGVRIVENAAVVEISANMMRLASGNLHTFDVCLVAASFDLPDLAAASGLPTDEHRRLRVEETLRCVADPRVIGTGDAIIAPDGVAKHRRVSCASRSLHISGRAGAVIKKMVCSPVVDASAKEIREPRAYRWPEGPNLARRAA